MTLKNSKSIFSFVWISLHCFLRATVFPAMTGIFDRILSSAHVKLSSLHVFLLVRWRRQGQLNKVYYWIGLLNRQRSLMYRLQNSFSYGSSLHENTVARYYRWRSDIPSNDKLDHCGFLTNHRVILSFLTLSLNCMAIFSYFLLFCSVVQVWPL